MPAVVLISVPRWMRQDPANPTQWLVDPARIYPAVLEILRVHQPTQYWVEMCYILTKRAAIQALPGDVGRIRFLKSPEWALLNFPAHYGMEILGAKDDPHLARLQRDYVCRVAQLDAQRYEWAIPEIVRVR